MSYQSSLEFALARGSKLVEIAGSSAAVEAAESFVAVEAVGSFVAVEAVAAAGTDSAEETRCIAGPVAEDIAAAVAVAAAVGQGSRSLELAADILCTEAVCHRTEIVVARHCTADAVAGCRMAIAVLDGQCCRPSRNWSSNTSRRRAAINTRASKWNCQLQVFMGSMRVEEGQELADAGQLEVGSSRRLSHTSGPET